MVDMSYDVGTHISFKKNETHLDRPRRRLYIPGTRVVFISWFPTFETLTVVPAM